MMQHVREDIIKYLEKRISELTLNFEPYEDYELALEELKQEV